MKNYVLGRKFLVSANSGSKGVQEKYCRNNYWYKVNKVGREGLVEWLVSEVLKCSNLDKSDFVSYEHCFINSKEGCRSKSFLREGYEYIPFHTLYEMLCGGDLDNDLMMLRDAKSRLNLLLDIGNKVGLNLFEYFKKMLFLDMLVLNRDRHSMNYGVIYNSFTGRYLEAPLFDNGQSLLTGLIGMDYRGVAAKTISGSFEEQVLAFGYPIVSPFLVDYSKIQKLINGVNVWEVRVLANQLTRYKSIFFRN